ncbi:VOC family protein [Oceanicoccus sp. KOV_DT_Chl]|uniref:VOC family protein n=1 Tax=Oceanicoccus sp. KOV_DT_Chl TaxID=1904639 RepID=UPI000C7BFB2C|nr:VOC family protein [Oceanicoccus sp. KOV_DT_Chl]
MANMRINHMELTFPEGFLTAENKKAIGDFYKELFGWDTIEVEIVGQKALLLMLDAEVSQFILCAESPDPLHSPGYDHLGLLFETRAEVDALLAKAKALQAENPDIQIKEYDDLVVEPTTVRAFYVKCLLPIWFDVQCIEYQQGTAPAKQWTYS